MLNEHYIFVPLQERKDLCSDCIALLNMEWPRSVGARLNTLRKSLNATPPMSFIVIDRIMDKLVGHARLCSLPAEQYGCWVESVIIRADLRGKGLGRWLMGKLEDEARKYGFKKIYLASENKKTFYEKCGFVCSEPVLHVGANAALFKKFDLGKHFSSGNGKTTISKPITQKWDAGIATTCKSVFSPENGFETFLMPSSPPKLLDSSSTFSTKISTYGKKTQYMCKIIN